MNLAWQKTFGGSAWQHLYMYGTDAQEKQIKIQHITKCGTTELLTCPSMSVGMHSLHACTKRQTHTPRFTHGEVCINRIPKQIQRMEVLHSIHTSHHHI